MAGDSCKDRTASEADRVRRIVLEALQCDRSESELVRQYPELQPQIRNEFDKWARIRLAIGVADEQRQLDALARLEADWARDRPAEASTSLGLSPADPERAASTRSTMGESDTCRSDERLMIGRYQILRLQGSGAFGRVYQALDSHLQREVAIKVPHEPPITDEEFQAFLKEARIAASIDHPAIVAVYDAGRTADGECYVVSKLIKGMTLSDHIRKSQCTLEEAIRIVIPIAAALDVAHGSGLVHRDIKPSNILLDGESNPYLSDFGLALTGTQCTPRRSFAGTPAYMSPEQARGEAELVDRRSDLFSLGIVLYELVVGCKPFDASGHAELLAQIVSADPPAPRTQKFALPLSLERVCLKALAKEPSERYQNAEEMIADLLEVLDDLPGEKQTTPSRVSWRTKAKQTLVDRTDLWTARPERRQLPSLIEWTSIRLFTKPSSWDGRENAMMGAAGRHHFLMVATIALVVALAVGSSGVHQLTARWARRAQAAMTVAWLAIGQEDRVWALLRHGSDPTVRTAVIHAPTLVVAQPERLIAEAEQQADPSVRRALLLTAGELVNKDREEQGIIASFYSDPPAGLEQRLITQYRRDPDPGTHAAAEWALRAFGRERELRREEERLANSTPQHATWFVGANRHTMVEVPPIPYERSPGDLVSDLEPLDYSFYLSSKETTSEQYERFLQERALPGSNMRSVPDAPQTRVSWSEAAAYCNWLSEKAGVPAEQWFYQSDAEGEIILQQISGPGARNRQGFRLPTDAEWEYACRSLASTEFSFGSSPQHIEHFAVFQPIDNRPQPVGSLKPNDFGLFDMHGNVSEWCHDLPKSSSAAGGEWFGRTLRAVRGGSYWDEQAQLTSSARREFHTQTRRPDLGFRVAYLGPGN